MLRQRHLSSADNQQRQKKGGVRGQNAHTYDTRGEGNKDEETERDTIIIPTDKHKWKETKCSTNASS